MNTRAAVTTLLQFKNIRLGDQIVSVVPIGLAPTSVTCLFLLASVTNETLIRALIPYGQVTELRNGTLKGQPTVITGTRYIQIRMREDNAVPNYIILYNSLVRSKLEYAAPIWDPHTKLLTEAVEAVQNHAARFISGNYNRLASVTAMKNTLSLPNLALRRRVARLCEHRPKKCTPKCSHLHFTTH